MRAIDLNGEQFIAVDTNAPGGIEMGDNASLQLKSCIRGIVGGAGVRAALFVDALRDMDRTQAGYRLNITKQIGQHIAPVAKHIRDNATAILLTVVPGGALGRLPIA